MREMSGGDACDGVGWAKLGGDGDGRRGLGWFGTATVMSEGGVIWEMSEGEGVESEGEGD